MQPHTGSSHTALHDGYLCLRTLPSLSAWPNAGLLSCQGGLHPLPAMLKGFSCYSVSVQLRCPAAPCLRPERRYVVQVCINQPQALMCINRHCSNAFLPYFPWLCSSLAQLLKVLSVQANLCVEHICCAAAATWARLDSPTRHSWPFPGQMEVIWGYMAEL